MSKYTCETCCDQKQYYHGARVYCADCEDIGITAQNKEIAEPDKFVGELVEYINNVGGCSCESGLKCCRCKILRRIEIKSDAWKKKFKA